MYVERINIEVREYKKRMHTFVVFDYNKDSIRNIHYNSLCSKIGEPDVLDIISCLKKQDIRRAFEKLPNKPEFTKPSISTPRKIEMFRRPLKEELRGIFTKPSISVPRKLKLLSTSVKRPESRIKVEEHNSSLSERIIATILDLNGVSYEFQSKLQGSKRRFDFLVTYAGNTFVIESNGAQHYSKGDSLYSERMYRHSVESDNYKIGYCRERGIPLYFVDSSRPSFTFIMDSIYYYKDLRFLVDGLSNKDLIDYFNLTFDYPYET